MGNDGQALLLRDTVRRTHRDGDRISRSPSASRRCNGIRTAIPETRTAEHRFKEINEAYEVLKDPDKRAAYDRYGHAAFEHGNGMNGAHGFGADFATTFSDIFDDLFGMGGRRGRGSGRERGADLRYNMEISLLEAFAGKTAQIRIPTSVTCEACSGSRAQSPAPSRRPARCARAKAKSAMRKASSRSNAPARIARAAAR